MIAKFFVYKKIDGVIITALPDMPDNLNFTNERGNIWFLNKLHLGGINWNVCDYEYSETGVEIDYEFEKYKFVDGDIEENENYNMGI